MQAKAHMWAMVPHRGSLTHPNACRWCTDPVTPNTLNTNHHVWFTGLITRIRHNEPGNRSTMAPLWRAPLMVYPSYPLKPGSVTAWPALLATGRFSLDNLEDDPRRLTDDEDPRLADARAPADVQHAQPALSEPSNGGELVPPKATPPPSDLCMIVKVAGLLAHLPALQD